MICVLKCLLANPLLPDWLTAIGTIGACVVALVIAIFGKRLEDLSKRPKLHLSADVQRPDSEKTGRWVQEPGTPFTVSVGEAWFFRLRVRNAGNEPAREVQIFLEKVEKIAGQNSTEIGRYTPMNLKWTHTGETTRDALLPEIPVYCDFIHISQPDQRAKTNEALDGVPEEKGVMCLDVQVQTTERGHLLEPGQYRCHLILAAENTSPQKYLVEVAYSGNWSTDQDTMFDKTGGFQMSASPMNK